MSDFLYVESEMQDCLVQPEDGRLWEDTRRFQNAMIALITDVRNSIGDLAPFPELCKNVAYYLYECLTSKALEERQIFEVCDLSDEGTKNLNLIKQLVQKQEVWDLAFAIHGGYLGRMVEESMLFKFPALQRFGVPIKEAANYKNIIEKLHVERPPLF